MRYSKEIKERARDLRREHKTYGEIREAIELDLPKATLSYWFRDLGLRDSVLDPERRAAHLARAQRLAHEANARKQRVLAEERVQIGKALRTDLNDDRLFWLFLGLYWGEGSKKGGFAFTNADISAIKACVRFLEIMNIPLTSMSGAVHVHRDIDREIAMDFWKGVTGIERIRAYNVNKNNDAPRRATLRYGTFHLFAADATLFHRMRGWLAGLSDEFGGENRESMRIDPESTED